MKISRLLIILLLIYSIIYGVLFWLAYQEKIGENVDNIAVIGFSILALLWLIFDAKERGIRLPPWMSIITLALPMIGVPIYLIKTKLKSENSRIGKYLGFIAIMFIFYMVGTYLV